MYKAPKDGKIIQWFWSQSYKDTDIIYKEFQYDVWSELYLLEYEQYLMQQSDWLTMNVTKLNEMMKC